MPFLSAQHYVVHTYAAAAVERLVLVRDRQPSPTGAGTAGAPQPRLPPEVLAAATPEMLRALFSLMTRGDGATASRAVEENEYLMRATMRIVAAGRDHIAPLVPQVRTARDTQLWCYRENLS